MRNHSRWPGAVGRPALTLIELLMVIATMAILAALLLPGESATDAASMHDLPWVAERYRTPRSP